MEDVTEIDRGLRRKNKLSEIICPVCEVTIMPGDIEQHYELEVDRLIKLQINKTKKGLCHYTGQQNPLPGSSKKDKEKDCSCPWTSYQKIRDNRHSRLKIKNRKRKFGETLCPVCNKYPDEDITIHVEKCLGNGSNEIENNCEDEEDIDIECDTFEEYEWAGQKRVRASSFLEGGYSITGLCGRNSKDEGCDEELNVDGDDTQLYGPPQYSERHIIPLSYDNDKDLSANTYLRQLVCVQQISSDRVKNGIEQSYESRTNLTQTEKENNSTFFDSVGNSTFNTNNKSSDQVNTFKNGKNDDNEKSNINQIVESLKVKIREYERQINSKTKCLICMEVYFNPTVSICCWHVHCENCWLRTLGARKLCPQCNMITSPTDLRRIYL